MEKYRACLELNPFYSAARQNLGVLLYGAGRHAEALEAFETVLNYQPDNQQARVAKGWALLALQRYAVEVFREATRHDPLDPQAFYGLGVALQRQASSLDAVETAFRKAIELEPRYGDALCGLGELLLRADHLDEAVTCFQKCALVRPDDAPTRAWLGWALQRNGRREEAVAAYRAALALDPGNAYAKAGLRQLGAATERQDP